MYSQVKYYCDAVLGVLSQCLVAENMGLGPNSKPGAIGRKMAGVVLKVNTKLGGGFLLARGTVPLRSHLLGFCLSKKGSH